MREDIIYLVGKTNITYDEIGNPIEDTELKEVFCRIESVSQTEFFQAGANGLKPQYKLVMSEFDYNYETEVKYNNVIYSVYRTFLRSDETIELYLTTKVGD